MWQTDWAQETSKQGNASNEQTSCISIDSIASTYCLFWTEHCVECAIPDCYTSCPLYVKRSDGQCARFKNGIVPNLQYPGLYEYGAEVQFRRWGKLESNFGSGSLHVGQARTLDSLNRALLRAIQCMPSRLGRLNLQAAATNVYALLRKRSLQSLRLKRRQNFDEFVIEVWNLGDAPVRLQIECWQNGPRFRSSVFLEPGKTIHRIPASEMNINLYGPSGMIRVYPENVSEAHLVFSWLDFVQYGRSTIPLPKYDGIGARSPSESKVKCVIWDLDNTAWDGLVAEQDPEKVALRPDVLKTMQVLDERGILQSIASKNDFENAWAALERLGVSHLFLHPKINWQPKSLNIRKIIDSLNIGIDSCAFIDDSPFERAEVADQLPGIRLLADSDVPGLLLRPEFNVPVTVESKQRRAFYMAESDRKLEALNYGERYDSFLATCKMEATLFTPSDPEHIERCLELLQRSNQLNLSTYRYSREEFEQLLRRRDLICICTACKDRFGDYGIVGFASVQLGDQRAVMKDFVLSCRVAQKKLENAWFKWMAEALANLGYEGLQARYVKSSRNGVLLNALLEAGFNEVEKSDKVFLLELASHQEPSASNIVSIDADAVDLQSVSVST